MNEIELGDRVKCVITGFSGIATSRLQYISGEVEYAVTPEKSKDGYPKAEYLSATRLEKVDEGIRLKSVKAECGFVPASKDQPS